MTLSRVFAVSLLGVSFFTMSLWAATEPKAQTPEEQKQIAEQRRLVEDKKVDLNGSSWDVTLYSTNDKKVKPISDTLIFQDDQVRIKSLLDRGYTPTNYTITADPKESESAVWETMQTSKEGTVFIRGEWKKDSMSGTVSEQLDGGKKINEFYFSNAPRKAIPAKSTKEDESSGSKASPQAASQLRAMVSKENK